MLNLKNRQNVLPHPALIAPHLQPENVAKPVRFFVGPGETVENGEDHARCCRVIDGCLATYHTLEDGRRQIIDIFGPGRSLVLPSRADLPQAARALTYSQIEISSPQANPELATETALAALDRLGRHATLLGRMNSIEKVAHALIDLAQQFPRKTRQTRPAFTLFLTRADMADWLGLTVETVSRTLNQFKRAGIIDYVHAEVVTVLRPERLADIASGKPFLTMTSRA
jgi:CRP/FNR family transcriptional regulator, anaerobic regulatory protein